jgi:hypothetical protein
MSVTSTDADAEMSLQKQAKMTKLRDEGMIALSGNVKCVVNGEIAEVTAYDPKNGRYLALLSSKQVVKVPPSQVVRYKAAPIPKIPDPDSSKYAYLKNW